MRSAFRGLTLYGDAPSAESDSDPRGVGRTVLDLPTGRIELAHPRDALARIYEHGTGDDGDAGDPPYWAQPWPSGIELAALVGGADLAGVRVLELGCGLALPSLVAAQRGARVLATDQAEGALRYAAHNARHNGLRLEVARCDWDDPWCALAGAPWDLVLAADVLYDHASLPALADLLPRLVGDTGEVWLADQHRPPARAFLEGCRRWGAVTATATASPDVAVHRIRRAAPAG
ncbi:class I SAM-dependent methyltransferase [Pseudonocardia oroxyli]|uniref:Predicted nicotinamide N-methyase n=1 Tax=Pseudonocardia oroxyli TaxID=366584 RepID=A0A1G7G7M1_PSEOR|nr:methyltransferase domain-containing protein [Pseudonocardia oroxyli]SDE84103.1 Predicted nicotinamide N-methyase [Pseudonocardia oroxyli]